MEQLSAIVGSSDLCSASSVGNAALAVESHAETDLWGNTPKAGLRTCPHPALVVTTAQHVTLGLSTASYLDKSTEPVDFDEWIEKWDAREKPRPAEPGFAIWRNWHHARSITPADTPGMVVWRGGGLVKFTGFKKAELSPKPGKKKKINDWSDKSQREFGRFLETLLTDGFASALCVALTYPEDFPAPDDHATYKRHLNLFGKYLIRRFGHSVSFIWKLEFQTRGAAHYHLALFALKEVPLEEIRAWMDQTWYEIAHNGDKHLGKYAVRAEWAKSATGIKGYLRQYLQKKEQIRPGNFTGRYWGACNRAALPRAEKQEQSLTREQQFRILRIARKLMEKKKRASDRFKASRIQTGYIVGMEPGTPEYRSAMEYFEEHHYDFIHPTPRKFHAFRVRHKFCADKTCSCRKRNEQCTRSGYYYKLQNFYLYCNAACFADAIGRGMKLDLHGKNQSP